VSERRTQASARARVLALAGHFDAQERVARARRLALEQHVQLDRLQGDEGLDQAHLPHVLETAQACDEFGTRP
jgi:hypothetical protein